MLDAVTRLFRRAEHGEACAGWGVVSLHRDVHTWNTSAMRADSAIGKDLADTAEICHLQKENTCFSVWRKFIQEHIHANTLLNKIIKKFKQ